MRRLSGILFARGTRAVVALFSLWMIGALLAPGWAHAARTKDAGAPDARAAASASAALAAPQEAPAPPPSTSTPTATPTPPASSNPTPNPPRAPSAAPASSTHASTGASVKIHDRKVFLLHVPRGGQSPEQRAAAATQVLERAVDESETPEVRVDEKDDVAIVFAGENPVVQLGPDDAAAEGDASLDVHAASVAAKVREAVGAERKRSAIATTVFSISLLVFSGLIVFLVIGKLGDLVDRGRRWIVDRPERLPLVRVAGIELIRPAALRGGVLVAIDASKWLLRLGIAYAWLLFALSLFAATRAHSERLTGFVLAPLSALMGRAASALPVLIVAAIAGLALVLLVRFVGLFFGSVARGETSLGWLPNDLARPTSVLVRGGIVVLALVLAAPLVTGSDDGALSRAGVVALFALGLASTPLLACGAVGISVVFGRRLKVGDFAEVGGRSGQVRSVSLLEVCFEDAYGCVVRVPQLSLLLHPTRVLGPLPLVVVHVTVAASASQATGSSVTPGHYMKVLALLQETSGAIGLRAKVDLTGLDADGARYAITLFSDTREAKSELLCAIGDALAKNGIALGRAQASVR